jgi:hypothetical protein
MGHESLLRAPMTPLRRVGLVTVALQAWACSASAPSPNMEGTPALPADCPSLPASDLAGPGDRERLFAFLTANEWTSTLGRLRLHPDGRFWRDRSADDALSPTEQGQWSLTAYDADHGSVNMGELGLAPVSREPDGRLQFAFAYYMPGNALPQAPGSPPAGGASVARLLRSFVNRCWQKANPFDLNREPEFVAFAADGRYRATYRGQTCSESGTYRFDPQLLRPDLWILLDRSCTGASKLGVNWQPAVVPDGSSELLVLDGPPGVLPREHHARTFHGFRQAGPAIDPPRLLQRGFLLDVDVSFSGPPAVGQPTRVRLALSNATNVPLQLARLAITAERLNQTAAALQPDGPRESLFERALDRQLAVKQTTVEEASLTFTSAAPQVRLHFLIEASLPGSSDGQPDPPSFSLVTAVAPPGAAAPSP